MPDAPRVLPLKPKYDPPPRGSTTERGYGRAHQKTRAAVLARHPVCQRCGERFATDLHHVDGDPTNRRAENLLAVCEPCHHGAIHAR